MGKFAVVHLKRIAGVEHHQRMTLVVMALVQPALQVGRCNGRRAPIGRSDGGVVHADDLALDLDQKLAKRLLSGPAFFSTQLGHAILLAQPLQKTFHLFFGPSQKQIDALGGQQDGAFEVSGRGLISALITPSLWGRQWRE